jgi:hypothetical protein
VRRDRFGLVPEPDKSRRAQRASHKKFNQGGRIGIRKTKMTPTRPRTRRRVRRA